MNQRCILSFFVLSVAMVSFAQAEMLYRFTFSGEDKLANQGVVAGHATVTKLAGQGCAFVEDAPAAGKTSCDFILEKAHSRAAKLELPDSGDVLRCTARGDTITLLTWVKWRGAERGSGIASTATSDQKSGWGLRLLPDGRLQFNAFGAFGKRRTKASLQKDLWTHVAVTWRVGSEHGLKIYIDGVLAPLDLNYVGDQVLPANDQAIRVGVLTPGQHFPLNGMLHDLRLYDDALNVEQIAEVMASVEQ